MSVLYLVATPIGNLEDISARALRILQEVALIAAEDTRQTRKLLQRYTIDTSMISYHEHNKRSRAEDVLLALANGDDVALVSDAGTPAISDPGYELVETVIAAGFEVVPIPGPCAAISGLIVSGLPTDRFCFMGFPPRRQNERRTWLEEFQDLSMTLICYEAPHRLLKTLEDVLAVLGNRPAAVARELTKLHEELVRGSVEQILAHFKQYAPRGELVLLIAGAPLMSRPKRRSIAQSSEQVSEAPTDAEAPDAAPDLETVKQHLRMLRDQGLSGTKAAKQVARDLGLDRQEVYRAWTELD